MAKFLWRGLLLCLSFAAGSFLTWKMTMSTVEGYYHAYILLEREEPEIDYDVITTPARPHLQTFKPTPLVLKDVLAPTQQKRVPTDDATSPMQDTFTTLGLNNTVMHPNKPRVLCWVLTSPETLQNRARGIKETWGPRCDVTLYMSSKADPDFPAVGLGVNEGRNALWNKTKAAVRYIYKHHFNDADWFMKTDDDTYVIVENLRHFLRDKNSSKPVYYGHHFKTYLHQGYVSGGSGYVMSKEALKRLVGNQLLIPKKTTRSCDWYHIESEDLHVGLCLQMAGVLVGDTRDAQNRSRFLPLSAENFFGRRVPKWFHKFSKHKYKVGRECCSDSIISIHYVRDRNAMTLLDYYIHGIKKTSS